MAEIVYVLTNPKMPGLVKIGMTGNETVEKRIKELSTPTGIPVPFECHFAAEVNDALRTEKILHQLFSEHRINQKREFFDVSPEKVVLAITLGDFREVTPGLSELDQDDQIALEKAKNPKSRINLSSLGINSGDVLHFSRDENVTATVVESNKVIFDGQKLSLSAAALFVLQQKGYKSTSVSGSEYWSFDGELLSDRRQRMEAELLPI